MIGAIVGEYFGSSPEALGVLINSRTATFDFESAWAGIGVACAYGIAFYLAIVLLERLDLEDAIDRGLTMLQNRRGPGRRQGGRMYRKRLALAALAAPPRRSGSWARQPGPPRKPRGRRSSRK